jgi:hypothetical protein
LTGFREGKAVEWCLSFAAAAARAAETSLALARRVAQLQAEWRARAAPRAGSAAARTVDHLPAQPILCAGTLRAAIGSSHQRASDGLTRLAESGVLRQIGGGTYDRTYAADELFTLVEAYERLVAHPDHDRAQMLILAEGPGSLSGGSSPRSIRTLPRSPGSTADATSSPTSSHSPRR